jgi:hypothetical protein
MNRIQNLFFVFSKFSGASSDPSAFCVPDLFEGQVGDTATLGDVFHFLRNVLLRRPPHVDVVTVARCVVARNRLAKIVGSVESWKMGFKSYRLLHVYG